MGYVPLCNGRCIISLLISLLVLTLGACKKSDAEAGRTPQQALRTDAIAMMHLAGEAQSASVAILTKMKRDRQNSEIISFERESDDGYHNPRCNDLSCRVFGEDDTQAKYLPPQDRWLDPSSREQPGFGEWVFSGSVCIPGIGEGGPDCNRDGVDNEELIAFLPWVRREYCEAISSDNHPPTRYPIVNVESGLLPSALTKFTGDYSDNLLLPQAYDNKPGDHQFYGCYTIKLSGNASYHFLWSY